MAETGVRRRVAWLILIRVAISTILLGTATFAQITAPGSFPGNPFFALIGLTFGLTIAYATTLRFVDRHRWLIDLQLAGDALIVSAFIYFTGGITSYFASLYVLPIVAASTVQFRRGGLLVATLSTVLYVGLVLGQYFGDPRLLATVWPGTLALEGDLLGEEAKRVEFRYRSQDGRGELDLGLSATHLVTPGGRAGFLFSF